MYPQIPAGYGLCRIHFLTADGDGHAFTLHGIKNDTGGTDPVTVANTFFDDYKNNAFLDRSNQVLLLEVQTTLNNGGTLAQGTSTRSSQAGGESVDPLPPNTAFLVRKSSGELGKHFRGRMYEPGLALDRVDMGTGFLAALAQTALQTAFNAWYTAQQGSGTLPAILHRNISVPPTLVTNYFVEQLLATQRRRLRKAAHH